MMVSHRQSSHISAPSVQKVDSHSDSAMNFEDIDDASSVVMTLGDTEIDPSYAVELITNIL